MAKQAHARTPAALEPLEARCLLSITYAAIADGHSASAQAISAKVQSGRASASPRQTPFTSRPAAVPGLVQIENFDRGGNGVAYHDTTARNQGRLYRSGAAVDITKAAGTASNYCVAWTKAGEWLEYTLDVLYTAKYNLKIRVASRSAGGSFHFEVDAAPVTGRIRLPKTGSDQKWTNIARTGITLTKGRHVVRLVVDSEGPQGIAGGFDWFSLTVATPPAPSRMVAISRSDSQIDLAWRDNAKHESGYQIDRRQGTTGPWQRIATVGSNATSYSDTQLNAATEYAYRIRAVNGIAASAHVESKATATRYSPPIVITTGGTYVGGWESTDPDIPAVWIRTSEPVIIENSRIRGRGTLIEASGGNANVTVRNTSGYALNPNAVGRYPGRFFMAEDFTNVVLENNYMEGTSGVYLYDYQGDHSTSQTVKVLRNKARNIDGRYSNGNEGFLTGWDQHYNVQFFQINAAQSLRGAEIAWNQVINDPANSRVEDNISIHASSGTPTNPILIHDNYIQGAYPADPVHDTQYSGGGIMLSDYGSSFVRAYNNQVISTTNYGIAISSGHDNAFYNNRVISSGLLPDGARAVSQNVGTYIWNQNSEVTFLNNVGHGNLIGWVGGDGRNDWWVPDATAWYANISIPGDITPSTEAQEWTIWQNKLARSSVAVGSTIPLLRLPLLQ